MSVAVHSLISHKYYKNRLNIFAVDFLLNTNKKEWIVIDLFNVGFPAAKAIHRLLGRDELLLLGKLPPILTYNFPCRKKSSLTYRHHRSHNTGNTLYFLFIKMKKWTFSLSSPRKKSLASATIESNLSGVKHSEGNHTN